MVESVGRSSAESAWSSTDNVEYYFTVLCLDMPICLSIIHKQRRRCQLQQPWGANSLATSQTRNWLYHSSMNGESFCISFAVCELLRLGTASSTELGITDHQRWRTSHLLGLYISFFGTTRPAPGPGWLGCSFKLTQMSCIHSIR